MLVNGCRLFLGVVYDGVIRMIRIDFVSTTPAHQYGLGNACFSNDLIEGEVDCAPGSGKG
jgi:hypothetical protein